MKKHSLQFRILKWIPRVLLLSLIGFSTFVYLNYRSEQQRNKPKPPPRRSRIVQETDRINYSHFDGAKLVYHVKARQQKKLKSNVQYLEHPEFTFYDESQKETITVTGKKCSISRDFNVIVVTDDARVTSPNGMSVATHQIRYDARVRQFSAETLARFEWKTMKGRAKSFVYKIDNELLILPEKPEIRYINPDSENKKPIVVNGDTGSIDRKNGFAYFDGNVEVKQGIDRIVAKRIELTFKPGGNDVEQITALQNVRVKFGRPRTNQPQQSENRPIAAASTSPPSMSNVFETEEETGKELEAQTVNLYFYDDGSTIKSFHSTGDCTFILHTYDKQDKPLENRIIKGETFNASFNRAGDMESFHATENVGVRVQPLAAARQQNATPQMIFCKDLTAFFVPTTGDVKQINFNEEFKHMQDKRTISSERAVYYGDSKKTDLIGKPEIRDESFNITADTMQLFEQNSGIHATGNVKSTFVRTEGKTPMTFPFSSPSNQPVYISAEKMEWDSQKSEATYSDKAKLWQEKNVITAAKLVINDKEKTLSAYDKVHTIFYNNKEDKKTAEGKGPAKRRGKKGQAQTDAATQPAPAPQPQIASNKPEASSGKDENKIIFEGPEAEGGPISVDAGIMNYVEKDRIIHFEREVKIVTPSTRIESEKSDFYLKEKSSEFDRLYAQGKVKIQSQQKKGAGKQATFYSDDRRLVLEGSPRLSEPGKADVLGHVLTLFLADGRILIDGKEDGRATTTLAVQNAPGPPQKPTKKNVPDAALKNRKPNEDL